MSELTERDLTRLATCHINLQKVVTKVSRQTPLMVVCGFRPEEKQNEAFKNNFSQVKWPNSKHNNMQHDKIPYSLAVDLAPLPLNWHNIRHFYELAAYMWAESTKDGVRLRWGGSFSFGDYGHYELIGY